MSQVAPGENGTREVEIPAREVTLSGELNILRNAAGGVLFAHGSGSSRQAYAHWRCEKEIEIVPAATPLFEEHETIDQVAHLAAKWFQTHLHSSRHSAKDHEMAGEYVEVKR